MTSQIENIIKEYPPKPLGVTKQYAVLLPLIWQDNDWQVLYEIRSQHISQPGEVSFPGGRLEEGESYQEAAIRETIEELNIKDQQIKIWGEIDYIVQNKRSIHCFVGQLMVSDWREIKANEEVDNIFTVPLQSLMTDNPNYYDLPSTITKESNFPFDKIRNGDKYSFESQKQSIPFYENFDYLIWGMTAQFTDCFTRILKESTYFKFK
ncbi:CoA pyrophosphatase [Streptococcus didelphis]|uniref:CoA pyrophosphatase n=1 Tax=Streptococcus didelphis TaxID=102886 RepID=A0ABY9LFH2_9STRE|nr:CoA pyrophosphatase [Streptococcus didelphis]WMB27654.1 CoA pyrophosphatase [Streptococcus didelphis]WMB29883.1 CoA pyrophosphatase [Streptococcus didelphis]